MPWSSNKVPSIMVLGILRAIDVEKTQREICMMHSDDSIRYPLRGGLFIASASAVTSGGQTSSLVLHSPQCSTLRLTQ